MLKRIDLLEELKKERTFIQENPDLFVNEVKAILHQEAEFDRQIHSDIQTPSGEENIVNMAMLDPDRIYDLQEIKNICIRYRLRFLDTKYFKSEIPVEGKMKIKRLNRDSNTSIRKFKIVAPKRLYNLEDADADPMLFAPLPNGKYYLIHKWGTDLAWYKKWLAFPLRSYKHMATTVLFITFIIAMITPNSILVPPNFSGFDSGFDYWDYHRVAFFFHVLIIMEAVVAFTWFTFNTQLSTTEWNKTTFN